MYNFIKVKLLENAGEKSYSINLIKKLLSTFKEHKFIWLMGADNLANFNRWYMYEEIINLINIAIFPRNPRVGHSSFCPFLFSKLYNRNNFSLRTHPQPTLKKTTCDF